MTPELRLIRAGIRPDCAMDIVHWYQQCGNEEGLERYIQLVEARRPEERD